MIMQYARKWNINTIALSTIETIEKVLALLGCLLFVVYRTYAPIVKLANAGTIVIEAITKNKRIHPSVVQSAPEMIPVTEAIIAKMNAATESPVAFAPVPVTSFTGSADCDCFSVGGVVYGCPTARTRKRIVCDFFSAMFTIHIYFSLNLVNRFI